MVRGGHRKQGVTGHLIEGAVAYAASRGAPAVEAHPVDEGADGGPPEPAQVGTAAQRGAEVGGQRPHVGPRRALDLECRAIGLTPELLEAVHQQRRPVRVIG